MKANNSIVKSASSKPSGDISFSAVITSESWNKMINNTLRDPRRAASFTSTLINVVSESSKLAACIPGTVISAALAGEALNLNLTLKHYSIVPYKDKATFQLGYKGYAQLASKSGMYDKIDVFDVRQGEYKGRNKITREPDFDWVLDDNEREKLPIIGYYAFYILKNGFTDSVYWTYDKILDHANRYSPAFSLEKYKQILSGKMDKQEAESLRRGSPWYDDPTSTAHMKMCMKTVLRQLLDSGKAPLSVEMATAIQLDKYGEAGQEVVFAEDGQLAQANSVDDNVVAESEAVVVEEVKPENVVEQMKLDIK